MTHNENDEPVGYVWDEEEAVITPYEARLLRRTRPKIPRKTIRSTRRKPHPSF